MSLPTLIDALTDGSGPLVVFWHRIGNDPRAVARLLDAAPNPASETDRIRNGVELDLKWDLEGPEPLLFLHHGPTGFERVPAAAALRLGLPTLDRLFGISHSGQLDYLIEIKVGRGDRRTAISLLTRTMKEHGLMSRCVIASGSLTVLREIRRDHAELVLGLFVSHIRSDGRAVHFPFADLLEGGALWRPLDAHDLAGIDLLIGSGPFHSAQKLVERARCAAARGLLFVAGRARGPVDLEILARGGVKGAFAYFSPDRLHGARR